MASTNKTTNYELSQFQSSDIPAWLTDYNGDMQKIDAGIHAAKAQANEAAGGVSILQTTVSGKQDALTFDSAPIAESQNPVTSGGIYTALQNAQIQTDAVPTAGSTKAVQSGGVYAALENKQDKLTFNALGDFRNISGTSYPQLRYLYNSVNKLFIGFDASDFKFTVAGSRWVTASDATFPSTNKMYYLVGNPFNIPANSTYPLTQAQILGVNKRSVGGGNISGVNVYLYLIYVSDENRTYLIAEANNPPTTNETLSINLLGDLNYEV